MSPRSRLLRFLVGGLATAGIVLAVLRLPLVEHWVLGPWGLVLATAAADLLHIVGADVTVDGDALTRAGHTVAVSAECSGLELLALYTALTLVYPVTWTWRLAGIVCGGLILQGANLARIIGLFVLSDPRFFEVFHVFLWPAFLVVFTCLVWAVWAALASRTAHGRTDASMLVTFPWKRVCVFGGCVGGLMVVRALVLDTGPTHAFAHAVALGGAGVLTFAGMPAVAFEEWVRSGTVNLMIGAGCAASPTLVIALAAVAVAPLRWRARAIAFVLLLPIFYVVNVFRVASVAAALAYRPGAWRWLEDYFLLAGLALAGVACLGHWHVRHEPWARQWLFWCRTGAGLAGGVVGTVFVGAWYWRVLVAGAEHVAGIIQSSPGPILAHNPEGILLALPVLQNVLFLTLALGRAWHWLWVCGALVGLYVSQVVCVVIVWMLHEAFSVQTHHYVLRGWVLVLPCLLLWAGAQTDKRREMAKSTVPV